jgi:xanthine/CO dehydrogenase XdhC/CoxF family maturation factor
MNDESLFRKIAESLADGVPAALACVVETGGSTPRKAGAKMVTLLDGSLFGTVGGGCVESKARSACLDALHRWKEARLITISLTDDAGVADGDVCGGTMKILVEPFFP